MTTVIVNRGWGNVAHTSEPLRGHMTAHGTEPQTRGPRPPRDRMVLAATELIRRQGVSGTGLREIVQRAAAPRGSLQHYFPGGKEQLVSEAMQSAAAFVVRSTTRFRHRNPDATPGDLFAAMIGLWRELYLAEGFDEGCPFAAATVDVAATSASLREATQGALDVWQRTLEDDLVAAGVDVGRAPALAVLMISTLEGALILTRSREDVAPLDAVVLEIRPLLDAAVRSRRSRRRSGDTPSPRAGG